MPSKTARQRRFMRACAENPGKLTTKCPPQSVAKEFVRADRAKARKRKRKRT